MKILVKCIFLPFVHHTKGFEKLLNELGIEVTYKTKQTLENVVQNLKPKTESPEKSEYENNGNDCIKNITVKTDDPLKHAMVTTKFIEMKNQDMV